MILVDSSVWIDWLGNRDTPQTARLEDLLAAEQQIGIADLVLTEVLQGIRLDRDFDQALARLDAFRVVSVVDSIVAIEAARNYRLLRGRGITIRKTIDALIATRCIHERYPLLYRDRDFDPFVQHLGLRSALSDTGVN